jgi:hypothetical protein
MCAIKITVNAVLLVLMILATACTNQPHDCTEFFDLPVEQQAAEFQKYTSERQVDIYLCGASMEPADLSPASYIVAKGEKNIPFLLQRLKMERYENDKVKILYLFELLASRGYVKGRQDVFNQLEETVSAMKIGTFKAQGEEELKEIKKNL